MAKAVRSSGTKVAVTKKKTVVKAKVAVKAKAKSKETPVSKKAATKPSVVAPVKKVKVVATPISATKKKVAVKAKISDKPLTITAKSSAKKIVVSPKKAAVKKAIVVHAKAVAKEITIVQNGAGKKEKMMEAKAPITQTPPKKINKILITQPKPDTDKSPYYELAKKHNIQLQFHPFIRVEGLSGKDFRKQRVDIAEFTAIVFTSRSAVDHFFRICEEVKVKVSQDMKYCCITEAVALYLQKFILYRKRKVFFSADGSVHGLLDVIGKHKMEKYLLPVADSGKNDIHHYFAKHNITFAEVTLYKTVSNEIGPIMQADFDMIVFFSPFSVQTLFSHDPKFKQNGTLIGAFGPTTSKAVEDLGLRLDVKAPAPNAPSMVAALEQFLDVKKK